MRYYTVYCLLGHNRIIPFSPIHRELQSNGESSTFPLQVQVAAPSSADTAVLDTPRYSHAIAILPYNPRKEPEPGYLKVEKGTVIAVMSGSRSAAEQRNAHVCDYVFAWQGQRGGWIPVEILESVPPCPEIMQKTNQSFSKGRLDSQTFQM